MVLFKMLLLSKTKKEINQWVRSQENLRIWSYKTDKNLELHEWIGKQRTHFQWQEISHHGWLLKNNFGNNAEKTAQTLCFQIIFKKSVINNWNQSFKLYHKELQECLQCGITVVEKFNNYQLMLKEDITQKTEMGQKKLHMRKEMQNKLFLMSLSFWNMKTITIVFWERNFMKLKCHY